MTKTLLLAGAILLTSLGYAQELKPQDIYRRTLPSVLTLNVTKQDGSETMGTAFLAIKDGLAITAWHVVNGAKSVSAKFSDGEEFESSGVVDKDETRDLAIIRIKVFGRKLLPLASAVPQVGSKAYVIGAPKGLEFSVSDGLLSQIRVMGGVKQYQFTCPASPGNSGGPLINSQGEVTGVVSWQFVEGQNLNFAVPMEYVKGLDISLPTEPWNNVTPSAVSVNSQASLAEIDRLLVEGIKSQMNLSVACTLTLRDVVMVEGGFERGVPSYLYSMNELALDAINRLSVLTPMDPDRAELLLAIKKTSRYLLAQASLLMDAIHTAQNSRGWTHDANDMLQRSLSSRDMAYTFSPTEKIMKLSHSATFVGQFPVALRGTFGLMSGPSNFTFGVSGWWGDGLQLLDVSDEGFAHKLGFRSGDTILYVNARRPTNIQEVKDSIAANLGRKISCIVNRFDERRKEVRALELSLDIPYAIPNE